MRDNPDEQAKPVVDCLPKRCPQCGRDVSDFFDHLDVNCTDWPEEAEGATYRDYVIERPMFTMGPIQWQWIHKDYDGPEDSRHGTEATFDDCLRAIDERLDE